METTNYETQENNKLIAEFMGAKANRGGEYELYGIIEGIEDGEHEQHFFFGSEMKFSTDWNWLIPVIKKIGDETNYELVISYGYCYWNNEGEQPLGDFEGGYGDIIYIYNAVVSFIKWYNANK